MATEPVHFVLIDCENVQPKDLGLLQAGTFRVKLFLGQNQTKIPVDWVTALPGAEYVRINGTGRNALDFHIAFYLGELSCREPNGHFHIITRDKGFDPLIKHLRGKSVRTERSASIVDIPCFSRKNLPATLEAQIEAVVANLKRRKSAKPKKLKTLRGTIDSLFDTKTSEEGFRALVDGLKRLGFIKVDGDQISYPSRVAQRAP